MDLEQRAQVIAGVSAFSGLDADQLMMLAGVFSERQCAVGETLMNEGEKGRKSVSRGRWRHPCVSAGRRAEATQ